MTLSMKVRLFFGLFLASAAARAEDVAKLEVFDQAILDGKGSVGAIWIRGDVARQLYEQLDANFKKERSYPDKKQQWSFEDKFCHQFNVEGGWLDDARTIYYEERIFNYGYCRKQSQVDTNGKDIPASLQYYCGFNLPYFSQ